jgi:membrane protease YdiL (CAAX protease family)
MRGCRAVAEPVGQAPLPVWHSPRDSVRIGCVAGRDAAPDEERATEQVVNAGRCFVLTVGVLVLFTIARSFGLLGPLPVAVSLLVAALVLIAWRAGAAPVDLGLARADIGAGVRYGAGAFGVVMLALTLAAVVPATNGFLHDSRAHIDGGRLLYAVGVSIVLLTAIPEEFAFRGVLLGSGLRLWGPWRASLITSALFGLWHIAPTLHTMSDNHMFRGEAASVAGQALLVLGSVAVTSAAGLVFCWLRLRSRSLVAPVIAHVAINGLALTVAWFAVH